MLRLGISDSENALCIGVNNVWLNKDTTITGNLKITNDSTTAFNHAAQIITPNLPTNGLASLQIGKAQTNDKAIIIGYREPGVGMISLYNEPDSISFTKDSVTITGERLQGV